MEFRATFDDIAGIQFPKAGITERIARKCDDFYPVIHDPCVGLGDGGDGGDSSPTASTPVETPAASETEAPAPEAEAPAPDAAPEADSGGNGINDNTLAVVVVSLTVSFVGMISVVV